MDSLKFCAKDVRAAGLVPGALQRLHMSHIAHASETRASVLSGIPERLSSALNASAGL